MYDHVGIHRTIFRLAWHCLSAADSRQGDASEAAGNGHRLGVLAITALDAEKGRFGGESRGTNDDARYAHKMRNIGGIEVSDGNMRGSGME